MEDIALEALTDRAEAHVPRFGDGPVHEMLRLAQERLTEGLRVYGPVKDTLRERDFVRDAVEEQIDCTHYLLFRLLQRGEMHEPTVKALDQSIALTLTLMTLG